MHHILESFVNILEMAESVDRWNSVEVRRWENLTRPPLWRSPSDKSLGGLQVSFFSRLALYAPDLLMRTRTLLHVVPPPPSDQAKVYQRSLKWSRQRWRRIMYSAIISCHFKEPTSMVSSSVWSRSDTALHIQWILISSFISVSSTSTKPVPAARISDGVQGDVGLGPRSEPRLVLHLDQLVPGQVQSFKPSFRQLLNCEQRQLSLTWNIRLSKSCQCKSHVDKFLLLD